MNVIEAVRKMHDAGGCIYRSGWPPSHYVTGGKGYYFGFHYTIEGGAERSVRARPYGADILADDWAWQPEPGRPRVSDFEDTITIKEPWWPR